MALSEEDRRVLMPAIWPHDGVQREEAIHEAVEAIVARHVRAALTEAAEQIEPGKTGPLDLPDHWSAIERLSFLSGMDRAARIVRNLADSP